MCSPTILEQEAKSETQTDSMSESGGSHNAGLGGDNAPNGERGVHSNYISLESDLQILKGPGTVKPGEKMGTCCTSATEVLSSPPLAI
jgi:hypothetical protein